MSVRIYALAIALAVAAIGLEVHRRDRASRERTRYGILRDDVELFVGALETSLKTPESCVGIFERLKPRPGATEPVTLDYTYDPARPGPLGTGDEAWAGTRVQRLTLSVPAEPDQRTEFEGRALSRYRAKIDAEFTVGQRFRRGVPASLEVLVWLGPDGAVESCFGPLSVGSVCNMVGGYYDLKGDPRCHQILRTTVGAGESKVYRGTCRVSALTDHAGRCRPKSGALTYQDQMGFGTAARTLCRVCE